MANIFNCPTCGAPLDYAGSGDTMRCPYCNNSVIVPAELRTAAHSSDGHTSDAMQGVVTLARAGKKIEAIKLYRMLTNAGLVEAKAAVENLSAGGSIPSGQAEIQVDHPLPGDQNAEIRRLLQSNQKIEAIKLYRQKTGVGLKEAKDAVEAIGGGGQAGTPVNKTGNAIKARIIRVFVGLLFFGLASIFPFALGPLGVTAWQEGQIGAAIGTFVGVGVWVLAWGGIGCAIIFL